MSANNVFFVLAGFLTGAVCLALIVMWQPNENPFLFLTWNKIGIEKPHTDPKTAQKITPSRTAGVIFENGRYVSVIRYDGKTFEPRILIIDAGENVRFLNTSSSALRVQITLTGDVPKITTYTQANNSSQGQFYELSMPEAGTWSVTNLNTALKNNAVIYVR